MGCWNGTCMLSNLPIISGEKIKLVILKNGLSKKGDALSSSAFCYPVGLMSPAFLPIEGEYNDYGMIENIKEDWNSKLIIDTLKIWHSKIEVEDKIIKDFVLEDFLTGIERGSLKVMKKDKYSARKVFAEKNIPNNEDQELEGTNFAFVMIRKDVWDGICKTHIGDFWTDLEEEIYTISAKEWCKRKFKKQLDFIEKYIKVEKEREKMMLSILEGRDVSIFNSSSESGWGMAETNNTYSDYLLSGDSDKAGVFKTWSEHIIVNSFIIGTRKSWMIQSGAGSQNSDWENYLVLNKIVDKICKKKIKEYGRDEE